MTRAPTDGRRRAGLVSRGRILEACRRQMAAGNFRPSAKEILRSDGVSERTIRQHFASLKGLHLEAIRDPDTAHAIVGAVLAQPDEFSASRAIVLGRLPGRSGA